MMDSIDPVTGLSRQEKDHVQKSWALARQDLKATGQGFFLAFFKAHPEYQKYFKSFSDVPMDQLTENQSFNNHAMNVMRAICMVADSLDDTDSLVQALKKLGESHGRRSIQVSHFRNLSVVLVAFLESALGPDNFSDPAKQSWIKAMDVIISVVETGLNASS